MLLKNNTSKLSNKADPISIETGIKLDNVDTYLQNKAPNIAQPQNLLKKDINVPSAVYFNHCGVHF